MIKNKIQTSPKEKIFNGRGDPFAPESSPAHEVVHHSRRNIAHLVTIGPNPKSQVCFLARVEIVLIKTACFKKELPLNEDPGGAPESGISGDVVSFRVFLHPSFVKPTPTRHNNSPRRLDQVSSFILRKKHLARAR